MEKAQKYIESLRKSGFSIETVRKIVEDYGNKETVKVNGKYNWNHRIEGFCLSKGELSIEIYWQGDSTDGTTFIKASRFCGRSTVTVPAESFFDGYRTREVHPDLRITKDELESTVQPLIEWLSPDRIKQRELRRRERDAYEKVRNYMRENLTEEFKNRDYYRYQRKWLEINQYISNNALELVRLPEEELEKRLWEKFSE